LVNNGADVDGVVREGNEMTPLALACDEGQVSVVEYLIFRNASLYGRATSYADTPRYSALHCRDAEIVQLLLENGVDANHFCGGLDKGGCRNGRGKYSTPLIEACKGNGMGGDEEEEDAVYDLARLLLEYGQIPTSGHRLTAIHLCKLHALRINRRLQSFFCLMARILMHHVPSVLSIA
jgi:ankyrin repeat protein